MSRVAILPTAIEKIRLRTRPGVEFAVAKLKVLLRLRANTVHVNARLIG